MERIRIQSKARVSMYGLLRGEAGSQGARSVSFNEQVEPAQW